MNPLAPCQARRLDVERHFVPLDAAFSPNSVFRTFNHGVSVDECPASEPQEDVLERRPPHECALRAQSSFVHLAQSRVTVDRVQKKPVGKDLHPLGDALQPRLQRPRARRGRTAARAPRASRSARSARVALPSAAKRPVVHDRQPVAELLGLVHVVRGDDQGDALLLQPVEPVPQKVPRLRVEPGGRLVEDQKLRVAR